MPKTITEFEAMLPTIKASGMLPIAYGDVEKSPGIHIYGITQAAIAGEQAVTDLVTAKSGAWTDEPSVKAAQTIQDWATKGYSRAPRNLPHDALADFGKGSRPFVITAPGSAQGDQDLGADAASSRWAGRVDTPVTTAASDWPGHHTGSSTDVASAYIDFTQPERPGADRQLQPAGPCSADGAQDGTLRRRSNELHGPRRSGLGALLIPPPRPSMTRFGRLSRADGGN